MSTPDVRLAAVTVTYGDRVELCSQCVDAALQAGVDHIYVVTNGLEVATRERLGQSLKAHSGLITFIDFTANYGAATGFAAGMEQAFADGYDHTLLVDDDNTLPSDAAAVLKPLIAASHSRAGKSTQYLCHRPSEKWQVLSIEAGMDRTPPAGSFMYFDLIERVRWSRRTTPTARVAGISIETAPFGGLCVSRDAVEAAGYPRRDMLLYEDDTEFTWRLSAAGFAIELIPNLVVNDIDNKWSEAGSKARLSSLKSGSSARLWIATRNRVFVDRLRAAAGRRSLRFWLNGAVFVSGLLVLGTLRRAFRSLAISLSGVRFGLSRHPLSAAVPTSAEASWLRLSPYTDELPRVVRV